MANETPASMSRVQNRERPPHITESVLPVIGRVSLGIKDPSKNGAPKSTGYFVFKTADPVWQQLIWGNYGEKPTRLLVSFPVASPEFSCKNVIQYSAKVDGKAEIIAETDNMGMITRNATTGKMERLSAETIENHGGLDALKKKVSDKYPGGKWKDTLRLRFILYPVQIDENLNFSPAMQDVPVMFGVFELFMGGSESISNIISTLDTLDSWTKLKFVLTYEMKKNSKGIFPVLKLFPLINSSFLTSSQMEPGTLGLEPGDDQQVF